MIQANIHQAKTQLSRLIERAEAGEEVVIARNGKPAVRLAPVEAHGRMPAFGALRGKLALAPAEAWADGATVQRSGRRSVVGCMAEEAQMPAQAYLRRLGEQIAAEMLDAAKFDVELDDDLEFIPAATR